MDVRIHTVYKSWLGAPRASTQVIQLPLSRVRGQAALSAVSGSPAWVRIADMRGSAWLSEAPFGRQTVLETTTDLVVLQVWADLDVQAAAVGTLFLSPPYMTREIDLEPVFRYGELRPAEESSRVGYTPEGVITGVHSYVRYEGADPLHHDQIVRVLRDSSDTGDELHYTPVETPDLLATGRLRIDPATRRLIID